jgi:hypothetical protein
MSTPLKIVAWIMLSAGVAAADDRAELGGGIDFTMLGTYDVGEALGGPAERNDLGPGTLGVFVGLDVPVAPVRIGVDAGIAIGGLVRTDDRYFGGTSDVGSTLAVWLRGKVGWSPRARIRIGGAVAVERFVEATGAGSVKLSSVVAGPWASIRLGRGVLAEVHADVHVPYRASIGDAMSGDPDSVFVGAGVRLGYVFDVGGR